VREPILFSVIIPTYNSVQYLDRCLASVSRAARRLEGVEVIVVDNGSRDGTSDLLANKYASVARVFVQAGGTVAGLRNLGASHALGEYLFFLDSDCLVPEDYFCKAEEVLASVHPDATGSKCEAPEPPHWIEETWLGLHRRTRDGRVSYINSGNLIVRRAAFDGVAGFDASIPTDEDAELGQRLRAAGFAIYEAHSLRAVHLRNPKSIPAFFRKELWRGLGLLRAPRAGALDKVLVASTVHLILILAALAGACASRLDWRARLGLVLGTMCAVPVGSVLYRYVTLRRVYRPARSSLLYFVFLSAKAVAVVWSALGRLRERMAPGQGHHAL
jgi:glycosyltransferase involved in cell wall biosynthesis